MAERKSRLSQKRIKEKQKTFKRNMMQREYQIIFRLDVMRNLRIAFACLSYLVWMMIAQMGFRNIYGLLSLLVGHDDVEVSQKFLALKETINAIGGSLFIIMFFCLTALQVLKIAGQGGTITALLQPFKRGLRMMCREGTALLVFAVIAGEVTDAELKKPLMRLFVFLIPYLVILMAERKTLKRIAREVQDEIVIESFVIETSYGKFNNVELSVFKSDSKWEKYLYRSEHPLFVGCYNKEIQEAVYDTGAIAVGETMLLKDAFGDYEIVCQPKEPDLDN